MEKAKKKKFFTAAIISALVGVIIYDHRDSIKSGATKSWTWVKDKSTGIANVFKQKH